MTLKAIFLLIMAGVTFIVMPIVLIWSMVDMLSGKSKGRERRGGGAVSSFVGGAMIEMDRLVRPSVEHTVQVEDERLEDEDNDGE